MADVKFEVTRFALSTAAATNTQDVTISGFGTPKAAIFIFSSGVTDDTLAADFLMGIGWTDGTRENAVCVRSEDAVGTSNTSRIQRTDRVITYCNVAGSSEIGGFSFDSWITDGIRLYIDNDSSAFLCTCILVGGADVTDVYCDMHDNIGATTDITAPGFEPDLVFITSLGTGVTPPSVATHNTFSFGCGINDGADTQRTLITRSTDGFIRGDCVAQIHNDAIAGQSQGWDAVIGSYDSNGFSVVPSGSPGSDIIFYICFKFSNSPIVELFDMEWPTGGNYVESGLSGSPDFGFIATVDGPTTRNALTAGGVVTGISFSAFNESAIYTTSASDHDDADPTVAKSVSNDELKILDNQGATYPVVASGYSLNSDGWTFTLSTNPASAILGWGLAIDGGTQDGARISVPSPLGAPEISVYTPDMYIASPSPLGAPAVFTHLIPTTRISVPSPLDASETIVVNDFTTLVVPPDLYVMDLTTPSGVVRVPISSWQATLQTDRANYGQCVIPSVDAWLTEVAAATDFTVYRVATTNNNTIEHLMLDSAITLKQYYETPSGYVCTISGNYTGYTADEDPPTGYDRTLTGVRQITNTPGGIRVRCNIDFLLRPAQRAYVNGTPFIVSYINYYVLQGDAYMDVGERL